MTSRLAYRIGDSIVVLCNGIVSLIEHARRLFRLRSVENVSASQVQEALTRSDNVTVLVDVRSENERQVSFISGSISLNEYLIDFDRYKTKEVIAYCTVGGRSYFYAAWLANKGVDAKNFSGGVIEWCRASLPLRSLNESTTTKVHTYWPIFWVPDEYKYSTRIDRADCD